MTWGSGAPKRPGLCPRCGKHPKGVEVIIQGRDFQRDKGVPMRYFGTRARRVCEPCAQEIFETCELILDSRVET